MDDKCNNLRCMHQSTYAITKEDVHAENNRKMKEALQELTPQEIQQRIHMEKMRAQAKAGNERPVHIDDPEIMEKMRDQAVSVDNGALPVPANEASAALRAAVVAMLEGGMPFVIIVDNGGQGPDNPQLSAHADGFSGPEVVGLLDVFHDRFKEKCK